MPTDGDSSFQGINMLIDRGSLPPGYLARCENKRLRDGAASTRPGKSFPGEFNPPFANTIIGSGVYSNPNGDEVLLIATAGATYVWACEYNKDPKQIPLVTGNTGFSFVHFCQAFDKVLLFRYPFGSGFTMVWDGLDPAGFAIVTLSTNGLNLIPQTILGVPFMNRVLLYSPYFMSVPFRDQVVMTDTLDYSSYDNVLGIFRINAGESAIITSVFPYFQGAIVIFMQNSTHLLENFTSDPMQASQRMLSDRLGAVGYQGPVLVGTDVIFLARTRGFYRLSQIITDTRIAAEPVPLSRPIQPVIDTIDWDRAALYHSSAALDDYAYFAVPRLNKTGAADAVLVLDTTNNEWESAPDWWQDADFRLNRLHVTIYGNAKRLFGVDYANTAVYLLYDGLMDESANGDLRPVYDVIETRGYVSSAITAGTYTSAPTPASFKRTDRCAIGLRTWDPIAKITALSDGVNEEKEIATITKDRLQFYPHGHPPFDPINGDPNEPLRQDYSIVEEEIAIEDFEDLPLGPLSAIPATPLVYNGIKQQSLERFEIRQIGRWCSLRIESFSGQTDVLGVAIDSHQILETTRTVA